MVQNFYSSKAFEALIKWHETFTLIDPIIGGILRNPFKLLKAITKHFIKWVIHKFLLVHKVHILVAEFTLLLKLRSADGTSGEFVRAVGFGTTSVI